MLRSAIARVLFPRATVAATIHPLHSSHSIKTFAEPATAPEIPTPPLDTSSTDKAPKLVKIVDEISQLTLLEVSELNKLLKETLNISDVPMMTGYGAPMTDLASSEDDAPVTKEQTEFTVRLNSFGADSKIKVIKAVKALMPEMNLVKAKGFVESLPQVVKKDVPKEEADEAFKVLSEAGGTAVVD